MRSNAGAAFGFGLVCLTLKRIDECPCAVQRRRSSVGVSPTWQLLLQPVAIGAVAEVTKLPKPSMERVAWRLREQAGRNVSKRRIGLETDNAGADPADIWGRPMSSISGEQPDPIDGPAGVVATACLRRRTNATREAPAVA